MIPIRDNLFSRERPVVTYTLIALNILIFLWDRNFQVFGPSIVFADLAMRPADVMSALRGQGDPSALGTLFTCVFLHGGVAHIMGNMLFLLAFGPNVERALGGWRFVIYYLFWGVVASAAHTFVNPTSDAPTVGASGAIGGVLGSYLFLFPSSRITFLVPPFVFTPFVVAAWVLLGFWFLYQIFIPQPGVANWAHAGGFLAGMVTVLILGGRAKVLKAVRLEEQPEEEWA